MLNLWGIGPLIASAPPLIKVFSNAVNFHGETTAASDPPAFLAGKLMVVSRLKGKIRK